MDRTRYKKKGKVFIADFVETIANQNNYRNYDEKGGFITFTIVPVDRASYGSLLNKKCI